MSVSLIPETAPFNADQRAWLNGFFAGLLSMNDGRNANPLADALSAVATLPETNGHAAEEDFPWHDPALAMDERLALAEAKPIEHKLMAAMAQLDCGACGYVCRTYAEAIAKGEEKDFTRCSPGGSNTAKMLKKLVQLASPANAQPSLPLAPRATNGSTYSRTAPFRATLLSSHRLTHQEAAKDTRHVVINLAGSGLTYRPGDALGILPENAPELVNGVCAAFPCNTDEMVTTPSGASKPFSEALRTEFALTRPRVELLTLLAECTTNSDEAQYLRKVLDEDPDAFLAPMDVLDVLHRFPSARPPLASLVATLGKLQPRLYSISSAIEKHPGEVHLTVGVVRYEAQGKWFHGVASNFLGVRSLPGDSVRVFVQPSHRFQLPADPNTPIIMVGPGTGIAPFRAFLEYREATTARGKNWLFFGNQFRNYDYLYNDELEGWQRSGLLTRLDLAFSRDTSEKIYVQDRMREQGAELWRWLQDGAYFYVCGDAKKMAPDVDAALQAVARQYGGLTTEAAKGWVQGLAKEKRYLRDVY